jgi:hypothetical protein
MRSTDEAGIRLIHFVLPSPVFDAVCAENVAGSKRDFVFHRSIAQFIVLRCLKVVRTEKGKL